MLSRSALAPLALVLAPLLVSPAHGQTTLRLKFKKDQTNAYVMVQEMKMTMMGPMGPINMTMKQTVDMAMTAEDVKDDGSARVKTKFNKVTMEMKGLPTGDIEIDSSKDELPDNPLAKMMGGLIKTMGRAEFSATMSPRGEISEMKIPDDLIKEFQALPGSAQMGDFFSEKGLKNLMGHSGLVMPLQAVKKGDTWSQKVSVKMPFGKIDTEMKYTYQGPETVEGKTLEKISFVPHMTVEPDANAPFAMKVTDQKGDGTMYFDPEAGRLQEMRLNQTTEMSVTVANMNIGQKMDQSVSMKLKK